MHFCVHLFTHKQRHAHRTQPHVHSTHVAPQQEMCLVHSPFPLPPHSRHREGRKEGDKAGRGEVVSEEQQARHHHHPAKQSNISTMAHRVSHLLLAGLALLGSSCGVSSSSSLRKLSQYRDPTVSGLPIDYCLHYELVHYGSDNSLIAKHGHDCGKPVADEFCVRQGYKEGSEWFSAMYYSRNATYVLGDEAVNPTDMNMGKGEHTYIDRLTCKEKEGR